MDTHYYSCIDCSSDANECNTPRKMGEYLKFEDIKTEDLECNIVIELDESIWNFLRTLEVGSLLSVSELVSLATKYTCDQCGDVFFSSTLFQEHLKSHVRKVEEHREENDNGFESEDDQDEKKELDPVSLLKVSLKAYSDSDGTCKPEEKKRKLHTSKNVCEFCSQSKCACVILRENAQPKCGICGKLFPDTKSVRVHVKEHKRTLKKRKIKDESIKTIICHICNFVIPSHITLERHNILRHDALKPCKYCDHVSTTTDEFKKHELTHTNCMYKGTYPCEICGTILSTKGNLVLHVERMHGKESCQEYFCAKCGKAFFGKYRMSKHMKRCGEKTFRCTVDGCSEAFYTEREQQKHVDVVHLNIKPFHCEVCGESFAQKHLLNGHKLIHSDKRTFICPFCGKGFKQSATLYRHKKSCQLNPDKESSSINKSQWQGSLQASGQLQQNPPLV